MSISASMAFGMRPQDKFHLSEENHQYLCKRLPIFTELAPTCPRAISLHFLLPPLKSLGHLDLNQMEVPPNTIFPLRFHLTSAPYKKS